MGAASFVDPDLCLAPGEAGEARLAIQDKAPAAVPWHDRLVLLAQYLFWGVWWPFVILSVMLAGRLWCGVLCPEGALAEFASRHGRGGAIPRWVRWTGWPAVAFVLTTVYGQMVSVYDYPQAALLILGGSTVAAVAVGWLYGRGKRVWCRYLCPVSGVFALLARLAPVHFRVDRPAWDAHPGRTPAVDCAPLLDVKHLTGASQCHACGRCSGHREAVALRLRSPNAEILAETRVATPEALLLLFGILGVALGAFQWTVSPWLVAAKQRAAEWLVARDIFWPLEESPAWWLLTRHPEANDVFTWLDGGVLLAYIGAVTAVAGGGAWAGTVLAGRLAGVDWRRLALGLTPIGGIGLFLGLSMMTATHLRAEGIALGWLPAARGALLAIGLAWSALLGWGLLAAGGAGTARRALAFLPYVLPVALVGTAWSLVFYVW
ncbi:MAG: 4Fe-4S binding protein [Rhodocyclaceae bacterium]|nr:4Fe-4S binding protein [Rhodocyclaceae bacterium]